MLPATAAAASGEAEEREGGAQEVDEEGEKGEGVNGFEEGEVITAVRMWCRSYDSSSDFFGRFSLVNRVRADQITCSNSGPVQKLPGDQETR